jgi:hypothetical protein
VFLESDKVFNDLHSTHPMHDIVIKTVYPLLERSYGLIIMDEVNKVLDVVPSHVLLPD